MNQKILFQKAEIKKNYREDLMLDVQKSRDYFGEYSNEILNNSLSSTLLQINQKFLSLKLEFVKELKNDVINKINSKIKDNYDTYIKFLLENIRNQIKKIETGARFLIHFNSKDYSYFKKETNKSKLQKLFKKPIQMKEIKNNCIGGFKLEDPDSEISYNNLIDDEVNKNLPIFHIELSKVFNDQNIEKIKRNFTEFIEKQKTDIKLIEDYISYNE